MKVTLCFSSVGILYVSGLPTELDQIAVLACPLQAKTGTESEQASGKPSSEIIFSKMALKRYEQRHFSSEENIYSVSKLTNNISTHQKFLNAYAKARIQESGQCCYCVTLRDTFQSGHEGEAVSSIDTESHCEVRTTSDMKLSTACQQDFTLCPSASSTHGWKASSIAPFHGCQYILS